MVYAHVTLSLRWPFGPPRGEAPTRRTLLYGVGWRFGGIQPSVFCVHATNLFGEPPRMAQKTKPEALTPPLTIYASGAEARLIRFETVTRFRVRDVKVLRTRAAA